MTELRELAKLSKTFVTIYLHKLEVYSPTWESIQISENVPWDVTLRVCYYLKPLSYLNQHTKYQTRARKKIEVTRKPYKKTLKISMIVLVLKKQENCEQIERTWTFLKLRNLELTWLKHCITLKNVTTWKYLETVALENFCKVWKTQTL